MRVGYGRVSTVLSQDVEHQRRALAELGCPDDRIYLDHGYTGTNTNRPALREALAALRAGDTLVVTKLDRLARSVVDAHRLVGQITGMGAGLAIGSSVYDPADPMAKLLFSVLAVIAEFEADLISIRTREGLVTAKLRGRLRGRRPKLSPPAERALVEMVAAGTHTRTEVAEVFAVSRSTVARALARSARPAR